MPAIQYPPTARQQGLGGAVADSINNSLTRFVNPFGGPAETAEGQAEWIAPFDGVLTSLRATAATNSLDGDAVITVRLNQADTSLAVTIAAGETAEHTDLADIVQVTAGDRVSLEIDTTAAGAGSIDNIHFGLILERR